MTDNVSKLSPCIPVCFRPTTSSPLPLSALLACRVRLRSNCLMTNGPNGRRRFGQTHVRSCQLEQRSRHHAGPVREWRTRRRAQHVSIQLNRLGETWRELHGRTLERERYGDALLLDELGWGAGLKPLPPVPRQPAFAVSRAAMGRILRRLYYRAAVIKVVSGLPSDSQGQSQRTREQRSPEGETNWSAPARRRRHPLPRQGLQTGSRSPQLV